MIFDSRTAWHFVPESFKVFIDVDGKENKINMFEMQGLIYKKIGIMPIISYPTFSDTDLTRFRLIYRFENAVDVETFRLFYEAIAWKFKKYIDQATKNANRIWAGTNKSVNYFPKDIPIDFPKLLKVINAYSLLFSDVLGYTLGSF